MFRKPELVKTITTVVDDTTDKGARQASEIIYDIVDLFEVEVQEFFSKEAANIRKLLGVIRYCTATRRPCEAVSTKVDTLVKIIENWDWVTRPIQIGKLSRGLQHELSRELAFEIRRLSMFMFYFKNYSNVTLKVGRALLKAFEGVPQLIGIASEDIKKVMDEEIRESHSIFEREIQDAFSSKKFRISSSGIYWDNQQTKLENISRVRWGGTIRTIQKKFGYFDTEEEYVLIWGEARSSSSLKARSRILFAEIIDQIWNIVCIRLYLEMLVRLKNGERLQFSAGERLQFSAVEIVDTGLFIPRKSFFSSPFVFCPWDLLLTGSGDGQFTVIKSGDNGIYAKLSYLDVDNLHILEFAIDALLKTKEKKMSSLLDRF